MSTAPLAVSVDRIIDAPAEDLYDLISDLTRMGEFSPENNGGEYSDENFDVPAPGTPEFEALADEARPRRASIRVRPRPPGVRVRPALQPRRTGRSRPMGNAERP